MSGPQALRQPVARRTTDDDGRHSSKFEISSKSRKRGSYGKSPVSSVSSVVDDLARRVVRLSPSPRNPDRFHEEKSEIANELRRLAVELEHG